MADRARVRDYAVEYAKRKEREALKAEREGREFSMARARGHDSREYEAAQRKAVKERKKAGLPARQPKAKTPAVTPLEFWTKKTAFGVPLDEYRVLVSDSVERMGGDPKARAFMVDRLRNKYKDTQEWITLTSGEGMTYEQARESGALGYDHYFSGRVEFLPVQMYWYHGGGQ